VSQAISIDKHGVFEIDDVAYRIPEHFSRGEVLSYRSLVAPLPDSPRWLNLTAEQRDATEAFMYRRAANCVIPGFGLNAPQSLSRAQLEIIHVWIGRHRPVLSADRGPSDG